MRKIRSLVQYTIVSALLLSITQIFTLIYNVPPNTVSSVSNEETKRSVIIDPGHGGKDGGAISVTGSKEKDLNLDLSTVLEDILHILGYSVILTRDSDIELTHASGGTRKMQDLKGRLEYSLNYPSIPFVSIHMNKFPISKYSGTQIYYSTNNNESSVFAETVMNSIVDYIQPNNHRSTKEATSAIYLLHKAISPAILIECGFISNYEEAALLDNEDYRTKISSVIASGINLWYNGFEINKG